MPCNVNSANCVDQFNCATGVQPDFTIKRHDTQPALELTVTDCDNPIDLTHTVLEVSIWTTAKFKLAIATTDTYFSLADNIGFPQCAIGDIIVINRSRNPERMLIIGIDETNYLIQVQRGYNSTGIYSYKKGTALRIFRTLNSVGITEMMLQDVLQVDGTTKSNVLVQSKLKYEWGPNDTCLPGCFFLEFKLLTMTSVSLAENLALAVVPSFTSFTPNQIGCTLGTGVSNVRRFPADKEGYLIQIVDSPTVEGLSK